MLVFALPGLRCAHPRLLSVTRSGSIEWIPSGSGVNETRRRAGRASLRFILLLINNLSVFIGVHPWFK